jgi:hypothetical protein
MSLIKSKREAIAVRIDNSSREKEACIIGHEFQKLATLTNHVLSRTGAKNI